VHWRGRSAVTSQDGRRELHRRRYALAHPKRVHKLVFDWVWPYVDPQRDDPLYLTGFRANRRVLREACSSVPGCDWDPAKDLAWLVRERGDGVMLLDLLVVQGFLDPDYTAVIQAMHNARHGDPADLDKLIANLRAGPNPEPPATSVLPPIPTLLLHGTRDLSNPVEWALEEAARVPHGKIVIVKGAAHTVQQAERGEAGRQAVYAFLNR
jgi:pimeloyl-ACP methyl ester carboxylesterase